MTQSWKLNAWVPVVWFVFATFAACSIASCLLYETGSSRFTRSATLLQRIGQFFMPNVYGSPSITKAVILCICNCNGVHERVAMTLVSRSFSVLFQEYSKLSALHPSSWIFLGLSSCCNCRTIIGQECPLAAIQQRTEMLKPVCKLSWKLQIRSFQPPQLCFAVRRCHI